MPNPWEEKSILVDEAPWESSSELIEDVSNPWEARSELIEDKPEVQTMTAIPDIQPTQPTRLTEPVVAAAEIGLMEPDMPSIPPAYAPVMAPVILEAESFQKKYKGTLFGFPEEPPERPPIERIPSAINAMWEGARLSGYQTLGGVGGITRATGEYVKKVIPGLGREIQGWGNSINNYVTEQYQKNAPQYEVGGLEDTLFHGIMSAVNSMTLFALSGKIPMPYRVDMALEKAIGFLPKYISKVMSPATAKFIGGIATQQAGESYNRYRDEGADEYEATIRAVWDGFGEAMPEVLIPGEIGLLSGSARGIKGILKTVVAEIPQESITFFMQKLNQWQRDYSKEKKPAAGFYDYVKDRVVKYDKKTKKHPFLEEYLNLVKQVVISTGAMGGVSHIAEKIEGIPAEEMKRIPTEEELRQAAEEYFKTLEEEFLPPPREEEVPVAGKPEGEVEAETSESLQKQIDDRFDYYMDEKGMSFSETNKQKDVIELYKKRDEIDSKDLSEARSDIKSRIDKIDKDIDSDYILNEIYNLNDAGELGAYMAVQYTQKAVKNREETGKKIAKHLTKKYGKENNLDMDAVLNPAISGWSKIKQREFIKDIADKSNKILDAVESYFEGKPPEKIPAVPVEKPQVIPEPKPTEPAVVPEKNKLVEILQSKTKYKVMVDDSLGMTLSEYEQKVGTKQDKVFNAVANSNSLTREIFISPEMANACTELILDKYPGINRNNLLDEIYDEAIKHENEHLNDWETRFEKGATKEQLRSRERTLTNRSNKRIEKYAKAEYDKLQLKKTVVVPETEPIKKDYRKRVAEKLFKMAESKGFDISFKDEYSIPPRLSKKDIVKALKGTGITIEQLLSDPHEGYISLVKGSGNFSGQYTLLKKPPTSELIKEVSKVKPVEGVKEPEKEITVTSKYLRELKKSRLKPVTGLPGKAAGERILEKSLKRSEQTGIATNLIFFDVDNMKALNTKYGHEGTDKILKEIGKSFKKNAGLRAIAYNPYGDEFLWINSGSEEQAAKFKDTILANIRKDLIEAGYEDVTLSGGFASRYEDSGQLESIIQEADEQMAIEKIEKKKIPSRTLEQVRSEIEAYKAEHEGKILDTHPLIEELKTLQKRGEGITEPGKGMTRRAGEQRPRAEVLSGEKRRKLTPKQALKKEVERIDEEITKKEAVGEITPETRRQIDIENQKVRKPVLPGEEEVRVNPQELFFDPDALQFKLDTTEKGIRDRITSEIHKKASAGVVIVYERLDGKTYVVSGHHRIEYEQRMGIIDRPAIRFKESDGFTEEDMLAEGALDNIYQGDGNAYDWANFARYNKTVKIDTEGLPQKGKEAIVTGRNATDNLYEKFTKREISSAMAYAISEEVPNNIEAQNTALRYIESSKTKVTAEQMQQRLRTIKMFQEMDIKAPAGKQMGLFGDEEAHAEMIDKVAKQALKHIKELTEKINSVRGALKDKNRAKIAEEFGFKVENFEEAKRMYDKLKIDVEKWKNWDKYEELRNQLLREVGINSNKLEESVIGVVDKKIVEVGKSVDEYIEEYTLPLGLSIKEVKGKEISDDINYPIKEKLGSESKEVEEQWQKSKGIQSPGIARKAAAWVRKLLSELKHYPLLDKKTDGAVMEELRQFEAIPQYSRVASYNVVRGIVIKLGAKKYDVFSRNIILPDLLADIKAGKYENKELPFNYTIEQLEADLNKYRKFLANNPDIEKAVEERNSFMNDLKKELVKNKLLSRETLDKKDYFHHQVLKYMDYKNQNIKLSSKDVRLKSKGFQKARIGSIENYNTEYIEAEAEVIAQAIGQLETVKRLKNLEKLTNIYQDLKGEADLQNKYTVHGGKDQYYKMLELKAEIKELQASPDAKEKDVKEHMAGLKDQLAVLDVLAPFRKRVIASKAVLANKFAAKGDMPDNMPGEFEPALRKLIKDFARKPKTIEEAEEIYDEGALLDEEFLPDEIEEEGARFFDLINWLAKQDHPSSIPARGVFKAIQDRKVFIKETCGKEFKTVQNYIPEDHISWKPKLRNFYNAFAIDEKIAIEVLNNLDMEVVLNPSQIRNIIALGKAVEWIIPRRIAETFDHIRDFSEDYALGALSKNITNSWKQWILMNPYRAFKYNLNNMSGDVDITLAFDPVILTYSWQSAKDLWDYNISKKGITGELLKLVNKGVLDSGLTSVEIPDISKEGFFRSLTGKGEENFIEKYWHGVKNFSVWRENILRLAAYRYFLDKWNSGVKTYGASDKTVIDNIPDIEDKAARLARELIGDYGNISKAGQYLREHHIPFFSWMEINAPRYYMLMKNLPNEEAGTGKAGRYAKLGFWKLGKGYGKLAIKATMLYALATLWNLSAFPEEEEKLRRGRRELHLILPNLKTLFQKGKWSALADDGTIKSVRFQGALSDALNWFALEDLPYDIADVVRGKTTIKKKLYEAAMAPVNKIVTSVNPIHKTLLYEMWAKKSLYPDITRPRPIRDVPEYLMKIVSLDKIYNYFAGKPTRGWENDVANIFTYTTDPGETSYFTIRQIGAEFLEKKGFEYPSITPAKRSNALYYYRQAIRFKDDKAADRFKKEYYKLGGTDKGMESSISKAAPLNFIPTRYKEEFNKSLDGTELDILKEAEHWYKTFYKGK